MKPCLPVPFGFVPKETYNAYRVYQSVRCYTMSALSFRSAFMAPTISSRVFQLFIHAPTYVPASNPRSKLQVSWNLRSAPSIVNGFANPILHIYTLPVTRVQLQLLLVMSVVSGGKTLPLLCFEEEKPWRNFLFSIHTHCTPLHLTTAFEIRAEWIPRRVVLQSMG